MCIIGFEDTPKNPDLAYSVDDIDYETWIIIAEVAGD